jgi:hypothetical protein
MLGVSISETNFDTLIGCLSLRQQVRLSGN